MGGCSPQCGEGNRQLIAATWKQKEAAPTVATPFLGGPLAAWVAALRSLSPLLHDLAKRLDGECLDAIFFPHFLSGPLDARQRIEFLRFHMDRHFGQLKRIKAASGYPKG